VTVLSIATITYALHLISFPAGWSTPRNSSPVFTRPSDATIGENGTVAVILANQNAPQRVLIVRSDGTTTFLRAFDALQRRPFRRQIDPAACLHDTSDCAYFATVALARDGTAFVTLAKPFSGAYSGVLDSALMWNGSWHVVPDGKPFDHAGDPYTPTNVGIAAADSALDFAFNGNFLDGFGYDQDIHRPSYFRDIAAAHFGLRTTQLGLGTVTAMRGTYIAGADAGLGLGGHASFPTTALMWQCIESVAAIHPCTRTTLGPGVAYGVDTRGDVVGDDEAQFVNGPGRGVGHPVLWRDGKRVRLSDEYGSAYAISENGTIVGTFGGEKTPQGDIVCGRTSAFIADADESQPHALSLDPLIRNLGSRHVSAALGVADDRRILAIVGANGDGYKQGKLAILVRQ
jgi:hypothetical protein